MIEIKALTFDKSAEMERMLIRHNIEYNWEYNDNYHSCIDGLYDIRIPEQSNIRFHFGCNMLILECLKDDKVVDCVMVNSNYFSEVRLL